MSAREQVQPILRAAVAAADPRAAVAGALRLEGAVLRVGGEAVAELEAAGGIWLAGAGKAAPGMARGAMEAVGPRVRGGVVTTKLGHALPLAGLDQWEAAHPVPDAHGLAAAAETLRLARAAAPHDLVLCLLSGGASALWPAPPAGVSLGDLQAVTDALLRAGAPIAELNTVRKHLSRIAGGQLARAAAPARVLTLAISDVVGAPADTIGSGPTLADPTGYADALEVLRRRGVPVPPAVLRHLQAGAAGEAPETVKPGELDNLAGFHILASVREAVQAAAREAERLGYRARIVTDQLEGEAREVAAQIAHFALQMRDAGEGPAALLWGGETTVTVRGDGRGGRNQELALAAALALEEEAGVVIAAFGTDGTDGPTDAAGGLVDGETAGRARRAGLDPLAALQRNDAYTLLRATRDLLVTGPTGTNVNDLVLALVE